MIIKKTLIVKLTYFFFCQESHETFGYRDNQGDDLLDWRSSCQATCINVYPPLLSAVSFCLWTNLENYITKRTISSMLLS